MNCFNRSILQIFEMYDHSHKLQAVMKRVYYRTKIRICKLIYVVLIKKLRCRKFNLDSTFPFRYALLLAFKSREPRKIQTSFLVSRRRVFNKLVVSGCTGL